MENSEIILITNEFPFGSRETFLESEIAILSQNFQRIIIVPSKMCNTIRPVPHNVIVDRELIQEFERKKFWVAKSFLENHTYKAFLIYVKKCLSKRKIISFFKYIVAYTIYHNSLYRIISKYNSRLIYSYWFSPVVEALVDINKNERCLKIITRAHGGDLYEDVSLLGCFPFREKIIHKIDQIIAISSNGVQYLKRKYGVSNVGLSRLGVLNDTDVKSVECPLSEKISIISVSNLIKVKRVDLIAESIMNLALSNPLYNIEWNHFGEGYEKREIIKKLETESVSNLKYKFHGVVSNRDVLKFYKEKDLDLFINLSSSEGIPVSMMEAISFGLPILGTNVGGVSEIVNSTTGVLLPKNISPKAVSETIIKIKQAKYDRDNIRMFWDENYNASRNYEDFSKILKSMSI